MTKKRLTSSTTSCINCLRRAELFSGTKHGEWYDQLCESCVGKLGSAEFYRRYDRQSQRRTYAKDIIQPSEKEDFIKAYPDKARQYYSDDDIRKFG